MENVDFYNEDLLGDTVEEEDDVFGEINIEDEEDDEVIEDSFDDIDDF